jgi:hypothetical protein
MYVFFMTHVPETIEDLFDAFGKIVTFSESVGCGYEAARQMRRRGSIPVKLWPKLIAACEANGIGNVDYEKLVRLHTADAA